VGDPDQQRQRGMQHAADEVFAGQAHRHPITSGMSRTTATAAMPCSVV
jgi:3-polyprenyl-4-hydroxybenzoate decarboxylase